MVWDPVDSAAHTTASGLEPSIIVPVLVAPMAAAPAMVLLEDMFSLLGWGHGCQQRYHNMVKTMDERLESILRYMLGIETQLSYPKDRAVPNNINKFNVIL